ncbi:hypothetical protein EYF80_059947 [Liparis tanakae]|uniref:Uncharacterized protein n=1 Tax=Liparis tanakae TaxID=230148 RepID=A0A4Z2EM20_9TELE|nr:hypothetical protein EYF80_059947 [Liparis tanakae]
MNSCECLYSVDHVKILSEKKKKKPSAKEASNTQGDVDSDSATKYFGGFNFQALLPSRLLRRGREGSGGAQELLSDRMLSTVSLSEVMQPRLRRETQTGLFLKANGKMKGQREPE